MKKEEIIKILESELLEQGYIPVELPYENGFNKVAERIVKLFAIHDVSNRRELLLAFVKYSDEFMIKEDVRDASLCIDRFLSKQ